ASAPNKTLNLLEYRVLYNPAAYSNRKVACPSVSGDAENCEDDLVETIPSNPGAQKTQNTYTIMCSRSLSSTKNTLLDLVLNKTDRQGNLMHSTKLKNQNGEMQDVGEVEFYDTKEDPRAFQRLRADYGSFCYDSAELVDALSHEEGDRLLQSVSILKSSLTPETIAEYFCKLSGLPVEQHAAIRLDTRFAMLCRYSVENLRLFSTSQLISILKAFLLLGIPPAHSMLTVYEVEFCRRVWDMGLNQLLLVADLWRYAGRSVPQYLEIVLSYVSLRWKDLTMLQLVQLIYIIGEGRKAPQDLMQKLETLVVRYLEQMNLEEVGTVCLGFFKSNNGFSEYLMRKIGEKVAANMEDASNFALVNVLKMFRYTHVDHLPFLRTLGRVVPLRISSIGTQGVMHVALACASLHYVDENILNAIAVEMSNRAPYCRSKDVAKFLWSFGSLDYEPPNAEEFYSSLTAQLHKKMHEFEKYPEHLLTSLLALAFAKRFPYDLIDFALSPAFVKLATEETKFELKKDLFTLDGTVGIECPDYSGNRIGPQLCQEATELLWNSMNQDSWLKPEVVEVTTLLQVMLGGPQYVKMHMILPHTRSIDLEVHLQPDGKPVAFNMEVFAKKIPKRELKDDGIHITDDLMSQILKGKWTSDATKEVKKATKLEPLLSNSNGVSLTDHLLSGLTASKNSVIKKPLPDCSTSGGIRKLAVQVSNKNHYSYASRSLLGLHSLKRRQLNQIGFVVVEIPFWEWLPLLKRTRSEKLAYLHQKIFSNLS
uniref:FAST kinase domains 5 n=1 Tax=Latimeria chalumnae TaxID=7897 RepID=H3ATD1_LATCH